MFPFHRLRTLFTVLLAAAAAVASLPAQETAATAPRELLDLPYVTNGTERQRLDLYLPAMPAGAPARPLVVWVHGGGWEGGSKQRCPARPLVARGYVVASLGYRLSQQAVYPAQIEDCKAAVRWLRANAKDYGIDPERVGAWGESAGGHLVALLGTTGQDRRFDVGEHLDLSSAVQCVIDWYGPSDFLHWGEPPAPPTRDTAATAVAHLLGGTVTTHQEAARSASPVDFVDKNSSPFLIMHGDRDPLVPLQQSQELDAAIRKAGVESTLVVLPGAGHGGREFAAPEQLQRMSGFLDRHLGAPAASSPR